jgi:methionyl-tRNA formyltransferase
LVSFGKIIPESLIESFPHGIINLHPSLLPKYRGSSPIETAIMNQDHETGLTLMALAKEMDAGPIYAQTRYKLTGDETKPELYEKFARDGADILIKLLPEILDGTIIPAEQDEEEATYCQMLKKSDGELDPKNQSAAEIDARVRAFLGFPKTRLVYRGVELIITKTAVPDFDPGDAWPDIFTCAGDTRLQILEIISPKSGKNMKFADYLNGLK